MLLVGRLRRVWIEHFSLTLAFGAAQCMIRTSVFWFQGLAFGLDLDFSAGEGLKSRLANEG